MEQAKTNTKPLWICLSIILAIYSVCITINYRRVNNQLQETQSLILTSLKGSYYSGEMFGTDYTIAFSEEQFLLQYRGETVDVAEYSKYDDGVYQWQGDEDSGFVVPQYGGIAIYFRGEDKILKMKKDSDVIIFGEPQDIRFKV